MLDYTSEDIDGMDNDADAESGQVPPITRRWTTTSTYDVYMVDTLEKKDDDAIHDPGKDKPVNKPPKCRCQWRRSQSRPVKDSNTCAGDNETLDNVEDPEHPAEPTSEQDEREEGQYSPEHADHEDLEDNNYMPVSEEDVSLSDEDFIVPEEPLEQERFK